MECIICRETIGAKDPQQGYRRCKDRHLFHYKCLDDWMHSDHYDNRCPYCRCPSKVEVLIAPKLSPADLKRRKIFEDHIRSLTKPIKFTQYYAWRKVASTEFREEMDRLFKVMIPGIGPRGWWTGTAMAIPNSCKKPFFGEVVTILEASEWLKDHWWHDQVQ